MDALAILLLLLHCSAGGCVHASSRSEAERSALQAWKAAITEDPNGALSTWEAGGDVCSYKGVFCSPAAYSGESAVTAIDLNGARLKGTLVDDLSLLSYLTVLHLNSNELSGGLPGSFKDLRRLTELDLSSNRLSGTFPDPSLLPPSLLYLDLRFNFFSGAIPPELFARDSLLDVVLLNNNRFSGGIPGTLWSSPASVISLANNNLSGEIPAGPPAGVLKEVVLLNNELTGCIPEGVGYMLPGVEVLDVSFNSLSGHVPDSLSCLAGIRVLNVAHNQLSGDLPDLCGVNSLANLTVSHNFFSGVDCGKEFLLPGFDYSGNCIPGGYMQRPPPECGGFPAGGISCFRMPSERWMGCPGTSMQVSIGLPGVFASPESLPAPTPAP